MKSFLSDYARWKYVVESWRASGSRTKIWVIRRFNGARLCYWNKLCKVAFVRCGNNGSFFIDYTRLRMKYVLESDIRAGIKEYELSRNVKRQSIRRISYVDCCITTVLVEILKCQFGLRFSCEGHTCIKLQKL